MQTQDATSAWFSALTDLTFKGERAAPRGMGVVELLGYTSIVDMNFPIIYSPVRKIGYKFMAAEAAWILSGDSRVDTIAPFSKEIAKFSDDGETFFGAYGPRIYEQLIGVINKLHEDRDTRQAVLTIWRKNPPPSKDIPCTVAVQWLIRDNQLHCVDFMRSSDIWLGWPYDVFNFSMLSWFILLMLRERGLDLNIGKLRLVAGSQHLYERNFEMAKEVLVEGPQLVNESVPVAPLMKSLVIPEDLIPALWEMAHGEGALQGFRG